MKPSNKTMRQHGKERSTVGIRVDSTARVGAGHATRCIAIAEALGELGCNVLFIVSCEESAAAFSALGFECAVIDADEKHLGSADADALYELCVVRGIKHLLLDTYGASSQFLTRFAKLFSGNIRTAYIDDMYSYETGMLERPYPYDFDVVIGGDPFFRKEWYLESYRAKKTELLVDSRYIPIRSDLPILALPDESQVERILITTGSTNPNGALERMSRLALHSVAGTNVEVHVVVGPKSSFEIETETNRLHIHKDEPIVDIMKQCQIAFSSAGITLLELIALGMPTLATAIVDNQQVTVNAFKSLRLGLGCSLQDSDKQIKEQLRLLLEDNSLRKAFSAHCRSTIDRNGSMRIAKRLLELPVFEESN